MAKTTKRGSEIDSDEDSTIEISSRAPAQGDLIMGEKDYG